MFYLGSKADLIRPALDILFGPNPGTDVIAEGTGIEGAYAAEGDIVADFRGSGARFEFAPMSKDRFLVVNEMFHPRWLAFVDGQSMPVFRTNRLMMGVLIPKGATTVQMRFEPVTRQWGIAAFALLGVLFLAGALYAIARCPPVRKVERNPF
ncbi:MAG: hypothetical protein IPK29_14010 [Betaproteobacteria bacterium]|nr:hypothetical protein [Betaproteobacteria bacterium]